MAKYIISYDSDKSDVICDTYEEACSKVKGSDWSIHLAPDAAKKWRHGHPTASCEVFVLHNNEPVRAQYIPEGTNGIYMFLGYSNTFKAVHKTDGWLPLDWFRYVQPDDETMARWQSWDEYEDRYTD